MSQLVVAGIDVDNDVLAVMVRFEIILLVTLVDLTRLFGDFRWICGDRDHYSLQEHSTTTR